MLLAIVLCNQLVVAADRPNIVWVSCEDISAHIGCYGDPHATTPNIDQLAEEGVLYTHAFATAGVCAPCRSTVITGMYQTAIGTMHMRAKARLPEYIKPFTIQMRDAGYYCTNNSKKDYQFNEPENTWDASSGKAHWRNRRDRSQPFFSVFNFGECHESGIAKTGKYNTVTKGIKKVDRSKLTTLPPYYPDTPGTRDDWGRYYDVIAAMDRRVGEVMAQLKEDGAYDDTIVIFWSDHGVGLPRAKRWLYDSGMHVPLVVRVPDKFKRWAPGQPGTKTDRLVSLMDLGPTMLNLLGLKIPSHVQGVPFLGDQLPPARAYVYGARDRMDERYDIIRAVRDHRYKYIRNYAPFKTYYQYMNTPEKGRTMMEIRRVAAEGKLPPAAAKFMQAHKDVEELYDTENDPHELNNLAADPDYKSILDKLRQVHLDWVLETRDLGLIPEGEIAIREKTVGNRYEILQSSHSGRVKTIRDAASLALTMDGSANKQLFGLLSSDDPSVRYWGAIGLSNVGKSASGRTVITKLTAMLDDEYDSVSVAAAKALLRMGEDRIALDALIDVLQTGAQWDRLAAAIVLDEADEQARPVMHQMAAGMKYHQGFVAAGKYTVRVTNRALNELNGTHHEVK